MMKRNITNKRLSFILCIVLIAAMVLFTTGCNGTSADPTENPAPSPTENSTPSTAETPQPSTGSNPTDGVQILGQGAVTFYFSVVDPDGQETLFQINTDADTVGEALLELELIAGDPGDYGLYVKTVNGITLDWDKNHLYWAFFVDGEYGLSGVDLTPIVPGTTYSFRALDE